MSLCRQYASKKFLELSQDWHRLAPRDGMLSAAHRMDVSLAIACEGKLIADD